jgi:hypothetical protein
MEKVYKKITLTDFKNLNPNFKVKSIDKRTVWNYFPKDLVIPSSLYGLNLPYVSIDDKRVLRFYNAKKIYYLIEMYSKSNEYYTIIQKNTIKQWVQIKKPNGVVIGTYQELPSTEEYNCGDIVCVNEYYNEINTILNEESFENLVNLITSYLNDEEDIEYSEPFINMQLFITSDIVDCGGLLNDLQQWQPFKQYYINDIVFYEDKYYICKEEVISEVFENNKWEVITLNVTYDDTSHFGAYSQSRLNYFKSDRLSYDDDGNVLPYILDGVDVCLIYKSGYKNFTVREGGVYVDCLETVSLSEDGENYTDLTPNINGYFSADYTNIKYIKFIYTIGAEVVEDAMVDDTGVKYEEVRRCFVEEHNGISYLRVYELSEYSELNSKDVSYAKIINMKRGDGYDVIKSYAVAEDRLVGASYFDFDVPKITINRGDYAAMERHYILGEINSFDDLEKYRNNYFKL